MSPCIRRAAYLVFCIGLLILLSLPLAFAQSDLGRISGFIKDPSGATIPNAKVTVRNNSGVERQATTNESGYYIITNVPPGFYTVTAEAPGFQRYQSTDNKLDPSSNLVVDATLVVGSVTQTVEVSATAVQLQTESAAVQKLVTRQQIDALEINGRNPIFMANLVPGTRGGTLANLSFNFTQGPSNINGARTPESLITYDGAPAVRTRSNGTSIGAADVDSTQEIQILTADYAAEYGRSSGGQIRIISKSGTNQFHGAAYEYVRNTIFNANTWQRNTTPATAFITAPIHYNQFGYNIGGPVYIPNHFNANKDKLFFYWGQEWVRYVFTDTNALTVPTLAMRTGDFSELLDPNNIFVTRKDSTGKKIPVYIADPQSASSSSCGKEIPAGSGIISTAGCFPGNIIPANQVSHNGLGILNAYPKANLSTPINGNQNWFFSAKHPQNQRKDTIAVDYNLTNNQQLRFRRVYFTFFEYQPLDGGTNEAPKFFDRPNQTNSINYVWNISPTKVNELLISGSKDNVHIPIDAPNFLDRTKGAAQGAGLFGTNYNYIFNDGKLVPTRIPSVNMSSFSTLNGGPYPSHSSGPIIDASDSLTWVMGNHTWKFGGLFEYQGENDNDEINVVACSTCTNNQNGQFQFLDSRAGGTGVASANAALGLFDRYSEIGHRAFTVFRANMYEMFAQDSWKVRQNLTLNAGLRYTIIEPYHTLWGNQAVFDPAFYDPNLAVNVDPTTGLITGSPTIQQLYNGMVIPGSRFPDSAKAHVPEANTTLYNGLFRGVPDHYSNIQWNNIQPRLGIAYQPGNKTVFRAGGGRFYTRLGVSDSIFLGGNPPFQPSASLTNGNVDSLGPNSAGQIPLVVTTQARNLRNPEAWNWNFSVERELPWRTTASVGYVGRRGIHLQREADINQITTATAAANPCLIAKPPCSIDAFRPYKGFGTIRQTDDIASSRYNSLQVSVNRRGGNGLQYGVSYTLAKSVDNGSNQRDVVPDTYDTSFLWGPSEFDARHILVFNYLYPTPFFREERGFAGKVLGGWQISGIGQFQTGLPCSVASTDDFAHVGQDANFSCGVNGQYWVVNGHPKVIGTFGPNGQWFTTTNPDGTPIFSKPAPFTFNTQRVRNLIYQPGFWNWNMGLFKAIPVTERVKLQFRAEAFNVFNHPNWCNGSGCNGGNNIGLNPTASTFGKVLTKGGNSGQGERNLQLSLRAQF